jgi:hypothetical protein
LKNVKSLNLSFNSLSGPDKSAKGDLSTCVGVYPTDWIPDEV